MLTINICKARYSPLFPLTIVQNKKLNMSMYEWMNVYIYENVYYKSCTHTKKTCNSNPQWFFKYKTQKILM